MSDSSVGATLSTARHARYVGRVPELARFREVLAAETLPVHVVHVWGPGGIGKTSLLDEMAGLADAAGAAVARVDGRDVDALPDAFALAAERALAGASPSARRRVLLVDTYERLAALDDWIRRTYVPGLPASDLVVIAGRHRPHHEWRTWGTTAMLPLRNLSDRESRQYLAAQGVPEASVGDVLAFTHGHPLALALVAAWVHQRSAESGLSGFDPAAAPDLVGDLLARFVASVPTPAHRAALEAASVVRSVTVPLLAALLGPDADADGLFDWLRGLAFTQTEPGGLRLHEVVRETVEADLRWRHPAHHDAFHRRARRVFSDRLRAAGTDAQRYLALAEYVDLYRHNAVVEPLLRRLQQARASAQVSGSGGLRDGDRQAVRALVARHQGEAEAEAVAGWLERRPGAVEVFYAGPAVAGFLLTLDLSEVSASDVAFDPVARAAWQALGATLRPGERGLLFRSWLDADQGQAVSVVQSLVFARTVEHYLSTESLAVSALLTTEPDLWDIALRFAGLYRQPGAEAAGGPAAFTKDWRAVPPDAWLDGLVDRTPSAEAPARPDPAQTLVVLSEDAFAEAVRDVLKTYSRPHRLAGSPLLSARLVRERGGEPVQALQALVTEAAAQLDLSPRERPYFQALDRTYLHPAPTQAQASEDLDVPFSTYRRHLKRGVDHVIEVLWRAETGDDH